jgi:hypothetical protein
MHLCLFQINSFSIWDSRQLTIGVSELNEAGPLQAAQKDLRGEAREN